MSEIRLNTALGLALLAEVKKLSNLGLNYIQPINLMATQGTEDTGI